VWGGIGGYLATWDPAHKALSWDLAYAWLKRYAGLDVQDPEAASWLAPAGLLGTGWLTIVGRPLAEARELDLGALAALERPGLRATSPAGGLLLQAGARPPLGDLNRMEWPTELAEVAHLLGELVVPEPPAYYGPFSEHGDAAKWLRRLVEPKDFS
jgi:hypothetical protein